MSEENKVKFCTAGGWAAKIAPKDLEKVLNNLPKGKRDENLLVGYDTSDDASIYKISDDLSIVNTLDFFPPMIENPFILKGEYVFVSSIKS